MTARILSDIRRPRVVIVGAGFGGLHAARMLANKNVDVLLVDRNNFHTFTPLIYQVATCALDPSEVAFPVRSIFRKKTNVKFLLGEVTQINHGERVVIVQSDSQIRQEYYTYLILAAGSIPTYFKNDDFRRYRRNADSQYLCLPQREVLDFQNRLFQ